MREIYRILDANCNRAREGLRVVEDCGRFALNDPAITVMAKNLRSDLKEIIAALPVDEMLTSRDTPGDIGTEITSPTESKRRDLADVATAACKRLTEALRTIEEYSKVVAPDQTVKLERMRYNAYTLEQRLIARFNLRGRMDNVKLYVLMGLQSCCGRSFRDTGRAAIAGGADAIQLREKNVHDDELLALAAELRELTDETGKILIINDRPDIAAMVGADGVHLGQHDVPVAEARRLLRPGAIIGRTGHSLQDAKNAVTEGADYVSIGPVFPTETKDAGPEVGCQAVKEVCEAITIPVVPIGGITPENVEQIVQAGAKRAAVCNAVICAEHPEKAAMEIRSKF